MNNEKILSKEDLKRFNQFYGKILDTLIIRAKNERSCLKLYEIELLELINDETFNFIWRNASCFPPSSDFISDDNYSYQTTAFIGYMRGCNDILDLFARLIGDELGNSENALG